MTPEFMTRHGENIKRGSPPQIESLGQRETIYVDKTGREMGLEELETPKLDIP